MSRKRTQDKAPDPLARQPETSAEPKWLTVRNISRAITRSGSSPWVRLGVRGSKAYILDGASRIATGVSVDAGRNPDEVPAARAALHAHRVRNLRAILGVADPKHLTVTNVLREFLKDECRNCGAEHREEYLAQAGRLAHSSLGAVAVGELRRDAGEAYVSNGMASGSEPLSRATLVMDVALLRRAFAHHGRKHLVKVIDVELPPLESKRAVAASVSSDDVERLRTAFRGKQGSWKDGLRAGCDLTADDLHAVERFTELAHETGLRHGHVLALKWGVSADGCSLDPSAGCIRLPGAGGRQREIPLSAALVAEVRKWAANDARNRNTYVIHRGNGEPARDIAPLFAKVARLGDLGRITPRSFRRRPLGYAARLRGSRGHGRGASRR